MLDPERIDFSALDPAANPPRFERLVAAILQLAEPELARRAMRGSPIVLLGQWAKPMLAAAAVVALLATGTLSIADRTPGQMELVAAPGVPEVLQLPSPVVDWVIEERSPSADDLLLALGSGNGP